MDFVSLRARIEEQAEKVWDTASIEEWFKRLSAEGIPRKEFDRKDIASRKQELLDQVQRRAEDCTFLSHI